MRLPTAQFEHLKALWDSKIPPQWRRPWIAVGFDVDTTAVRAIVLRHQAQQKTLLSAAVVPIPDPADPNAVLDAIRRTLDAVHFSHLKSPSVSSAVRGSGTVVRFAFFPAMTPAELKQAVPFEADKYIPFQMNEVYLDSQPLGAPVQGKQEVLLVAAKKELVQDQIKLFQQSGISLAGVDLEAFALANAWEMSVQSVEGKITALLSLGAQRCLLNVFSGTQLRLTREFPWTIQTQGSISPADIEAVVKQLRLSYDYFENQSGKSIDQLLLTGTLSSDPNIATQLQTAFNHPVQIWNPLSSLKKDTAENIENLEKISFDLGVALGLALRAF